MSDEKLDLILEEIRSHQSTTKEIAERVNENKLIASKALQTTEFTAKSLEVHIADDKDIQEAIKKELAAVRQENKDQHLAGTKKIKILTGTLIGFLIIELIVVGPEKAVEIIKMFTEIIL